MTLCLNKITLIGIKELLKSSHKLKQNGTNTRGLGYMLYYTKKEFFVDPHSYLYRLPILVVVSKMTLDN